MASDGPDTRLDRVERALAAVLRPLSKILINNNLPLQSAVETLKRTLVETAMGEDQATDSLISLKTGVHRKDVKRIRAELVAGTAKEIPIRGLAVVLATWAHATPFCESQGQARVLPLRGDGENPGFDDLIKASKVDLAPATVLGELEAQKLVKRHGDHRIELLSPTFVAQSGVAALDAFEATVGDHIRIAAENVLSPAGEPRQFDQVLRYSHLSQASVDALEGEARKLAQGYLEGLNAMAHRLQSQDDASGVLENGWFVTGVFVSPGAASSGK